MRQEVSSFMQLKFFSLSPLLTAISLALTLSGCQLTNSNTTSEQVESNDTAAIETCGTIHTSEEELTECELANEGVFDVIHPNDDLLEDASELTAPAEVEAAVVITDVWERASAHFELPIPDDARVAAQPERAQRVAARERDGERAPARVTDVVVVELERDHACSARADTPTRRLACMASAGQAPGWA